METDQQVWRLNKAEIWLYPVTGDELMQRSSTVQVSERSKISQHKSKREIITGKILVINLKRKLTAEWHIVQTSAYALHTIAWLSVMKRHRPTLAAIRRTDGRTHANDVLTFSLNTECRELADRKRKTPLTHGTSANILCCAHGLSG